MSKKEYSIAALGFRLGLIAAIAAVALAGVELATQAPRAAAETAEVEKTMKAILPAFDNVGETIHAVRSDSGETLFRESELPNDPSLVPLYEFTPAYKDGTLIAFAVKSGSPKGYGGDIGVMFGIAPEGTLGIVNVLSGHGETPGLGTTETDRKKEKTIFNLFDADDGSLPPNEYLDQFQNKKLEGTEGWKVEKDGGTIRARTGATVTMRAITEAVSDATVYFMKERNKIIEKSSSEGAQ